MKKQPAPVRTAGAPAGPVTPPKPPPLFRPIDWLSFGLVTVVLLVAYSLTRAPNFTLQDSGEECVASMWLGVPHPPGYPIWTLVTWIFTKLIPYSNIAWRVSIVSSLAAALASGMIALMVSRGSSMFLESIEQFKNIDRTIEKGICLVSGFVAGLLIGFNGFLWSQAVIVEVYPLSTLSLTGVMICLMRWIYAPHQHRYLYLSWFLYGVCFNNHQSLLVIAVSMEVVIAMAQPRLGRALFLGNFLVFSAAMLGKSTGAVTTLNDNPPVLFIFCLIGLLSFAGWATLWVIHAATRKDVGQEIWFLPSGLFLLLDALLQAQAPDSGLPVALHVLIFLGCLCGYVFMSIRRKEFAFNWAFVCFLAFLVGAAFYLMMPIVSSANPPMNWGYPRTVTGFFHALTRGQYERIHPTTSFIVYLKQLRYITWEGALEEFNLIYLLMALVPLPFVLWLKARERCWLIGVAAFYLVLGPLFLLILLNPAPDRQSISLNKVFFTPSHSMIAMFVGYGLTFLAALLVTQYERWRKLVLAGFGAIAAFALYNLADTWDKTPYYILRDAALFGFGLAAVLALLLLLFRARAPILGLLVCFALMPAYSVMKHWSDNEQRGHYFGYWFGHDMFDPASKLCKDKSGKPLYPMMDKDTVLFGGTDPGRFAPTYMIFCESFIPPQDRTDPNFDRRDVYIITQNALADGTYLSYIRAHYFRSAQRQMEETLQEYRPFFQQVVRSAREKEKDLHTNLLARMLVPLDNLVQGIGDRVEKERRTGSSLFKESDFLDLPAFARALQQQGKPAALSKYLYDNLSPATQAQLKGGASPGLGRALARDLNRLMDQEYQLNQRLPKLRDAAASLTNDLAALKGEGKADTRDYRKKQKAAEALEKELAVASKIVPFYEPARFQEVTLSDYLKRFIAENPQLYSRIRLSRLLLEAAYPGWLARSPGGLYPDMEIYTPSNEDSQKCFADYMADAQERMKKGALRPGEDVRVVDNKVQVSGQVAVMAINGLLTKVIFDHNPNNEFYVEESFPLDWMYPHLTPFGIIMKINRQPVPEMTQDILDRDHQFWSQYSERLTGNWITYDTPISNICAFAERVYVRHDYKGFQGNRRFIRDDDAQKAFSKLRSSIGGLYAWRLDHPHSEAERQQVLREAEFAFKQAYAFCPYSPEALYRFVQVLLRSGRVDEAKMLAQTSRKLDPENSGLDRLVDELTKMKQQAGQGAPPPAPSPQLQALEAEFALHPANMTNTMELANNLARLGQTERVRQIADVLLTNAPADISAVYFTVQVYSQLRDMPKLETALQNWVNVNPAPESWLDLAAARALLNKQPEALAAVKACLDLNAKRLAANPKASNIALMARTDERLKSLQGLPQFQQLFATNR